MLTRPLYRLQFATWKDSEDGTRPFLERSEHQNDYIATRFDLAKYNVVLTDKNPDFLIILNHLNYAAPAERERTIGVVTEPDWSKNYRPKYMNRHCALVLTHNLRDLDNAIKGHSLCVPWIPRNEWQRPIKKSKKLSFIASPLRAEKPGSNYQFRHDLVSQILESNLDCDIYGDWPGTDSRLKGKVANKAEALSPYEFSVAIENTCEPGYSTEKLLDCFLTETQAVYLGDPLAATNYGEHSLVRLPPDRAMAVLRGIENGSIPYCREAVKGAKKRYLEDFNLISQVINLASHHHMGRSTNRMKHGSTQMNVSIAGGPGSTGEASIPSTGTDVTITGELTADVLHFLEDAGLLQRGTTGDGPASSTTTTKGAPEPTRLHVELDLESAAGQLECAASAQLVIFYRSARQTIASALQNGGTLASAVAECKTYIENYLRIYRGNRRKIIMMEVQAVLSHPGQALKLIESRTLLRGKSRPKAEVTRHSENTEKFAGIIANCLLQEDHTLRQLRDELEAGSSLALDNAAPSLSEQLFLLQKKPNAAGISERYNETENELLLLQLHQVQDELEVYFNKGQQLEKELVAAKRTVTKLEERDKQLAVARDKLGRSRNTISSIKKSFSWKITAPLRWMLGHFTPGGN